MPPNGPTRQENSWLPVDFAWAGSSCSQRNVCKRETDMSSYRWVIVACGALKTCIGIGAMLSLAAVSIYSVEGPAGLAGRLLLGLLDERCAERSVLICGLLVQSVCTAAGRLVKKGRQMPPVTSS
jgi:hypothetical protein